MAPSTTCDFHEASVPITVKGTLKNCQQPQPVPADLDFTALSEDELLKGIVESLRVCGGVFVRNMYNNDVVQELEKDIRPHIDGGKSWPGNFWPSETRRVCGIMSKSRVFATEIVGSTLWQRVSRHFLTTSTKTWVGDEYISSQSLPQVNNTIVFSIGPGAADQALHRDDGTHHIYHPSVAEHTLGRDCAVGFFVAGKKTTRTNGATRFVPGSHLWDYAEGPPLESQTVYAELNPGDAFIMLAGCFHGGSANRSTNEERLVYSTFSVRGIYRQEENQYLCNDFKKLAELPEDTVRFAGFSISQPFLGWVDYQDPYLAIDPSKKSAALEHWLEEE